jgi:hypothetical protein
MKKEIKIIIKTNEVIHLDDLYDDAQTMFDDIRDVVLTFNITNEELELIITNEYQ